MESGAVVEPRAGAAPGEPTTRGARFRLILVLGGLVAFGPLSIDMYLPALPSLTRDLHTSAAAAQLTLTSCLLGLALGQIVAGPISDARGRRRPLLAGLVLYAATSLLCAVVPSVWMLVVLRFIQGCAGAAGMVIARAIARDLYSGPRLARFFSILMLVTGIAPILAPIIGAQLLHVTAWRGIFVALAAIGGLLLLGGFTVEETLPPEDRHGGGLRQTASVLAMLLRDRVFTGYVLAIGLSFAAMFAYISGSPFVLQEVFGVSATGFSLIFGMNSAGIIGVSQLSGWLVERVAPRRLLAIGLGLGAAGGIGVLVAILAGGGLAALLPPLFVSLSSIGLVMPNASALALTNHPTTAGSASGLLGVAQFVFGAGAAPLVGVEGPRSAVPMAVVIAALMVGAAVAPGISPRSR